MKAGDNSSDIIRSSLARLSKATEILNNDPPELIVHAGKSKPLQTIAKTLQVLLTTPDTLEMTYQARQTMLKGIKSLVHGVASIPSASFSSLRHQSSQNISDSTELHQTEFNTDLEVQELHNELQSLFLENTAITQELNDLRRSSQQELTRESQKFSKLQRKHMSMKEKISDISIIQKQLDDANAEIEALNTSVREVKAKLEEKTEKYERAQDDIHRQSLRMKELEVEKKRMEIMANELKRTRQTNATGFDACDQVAKLQNHILKLQNAVSKLTVLTQNQAEEIHEWSEKWMAASNLLGLASQVIGEYDRFLKDSMMDSERLKKETQKLKKQHERLTNEHKKFKDTEIIMDRLAELSGHTDASGLMEYLNSLENVDDVAAVARENKIVRALVNSQLQFLFEIVKNGELEMALMKGHQGKTTSCDEILAQLRANRAFLEDNGVACPGEDITTDLMKDLCSDDPIHELVASQVTTSALMRECCKETRRQLDILESFVRQMAEEFHINGSAGEVCTIVIEEIKEQKTFMSQALRIIHRKKTDPKPREIRKYILDFAEKAAQTLHFLYVDVKKALHYHGDVEQIPRILLTKLEEIDSRQLKDEMEQTVTCVDDIANSDMKTSLDNAETQEYIHSLEAEKEMNQTRISEQSEEITKLKSEIEVLESKYHASETTNNDYRSRYVALSATYKGVEDDLRALRSENKKLTHSMERQYITINQKMKKRLQKNKERYDCELGKQKDMYEAKISQFGEQLTAKSEKIKKLKQKYKETITLHESSMEKQTQIIESLRLQNKKLAQQVASEQERNKQTQQTKHEDWVHLESQNRLLTSEKQVLEAKVAQLSEKCAQIQAIRDNYWGTQLSMREDELRKEQKVEITQVEHQHQEFVRSLSHILSDTLIQQITDDDYSVKNGTLELCKRVHTLGQHVKTLQTRIRENQSQVWEQWARGLFARFNDGNICTESAGQLRYLLDELISASSSHHSLIRKLESLRKQKKLLLSSCMIYQNKDSAVSFQSLVRFAISISRLSRKSPEIHRCRFKL